MTNETENTLPKNQAGFEQQPTDVAWRIYEEKFAKAFRCNPNPISIASMNDGTFLEVNDAWLEATGYQRDELIGYTDINVHIWADPDNRRQLLENFLKTGTVRGLEMKFRTKQGEVRTGLLSADILNMGEEPCILAAVDDISQRRQAEEDLQRAYEELEMKVQLRTEDFMAANQELLAMNLELSDTIDQLKMTQQQLVQSEKMASLGSLVAGVAHEVSTPIGVAVTTASHLKQITKELTNHNIGNTLPPMFKEYIEDCNEASTIILKNLERAAALLRSFKQVSVDQSNESRRVFNVKEYLDEILLSLHPRLKKTHLTINTHCDNNLIINSFPGALAQIITNLIMNSLLHAYEADSKGQIFIDIEVNDQLEIRFTDDGKGMEADILHRIFDPFFTTKRATGGTGLGLHILYNIVTMQLGGVIDCKSEPNNGTRFFISFPL